MKPLAFLKDRFIAYIIAIVTLVICYVFLRAFKADIQLIAVILTVLVLSGIVHELWEYFRKKKFYDNLINSLNELDKKYLLPEMTSRPGFLEGDIIYDVLCDCDKSMNEQVSEYRRASREFREYIELWVHEAKIPVAGLRLISHNNPDIEGKITSQLKRIDDDIENVLYYARCENASKDYVIKATSLKKVFGDAARKNMEALREMKADITVTGLDVNVMTDAKWLEYIFGQMLSNSMKYAAEGRPLAIDVSAEDAGDAVTLCYRDNGLGIAPGDLPYIFDKGFTGKNGRESTKSTGMGLYIVNSMCEHLGIKIECESVVNEYTEFVFRFAKNDYFKPED